MYAVFFLFMYLIIYFLEKAPSHGQTFESSFWYATGLLYLYCVLCHDEKSHSNQCTKNASLLRILTLIVAGNKNRCKRIIRQLLDWEMLMRWTYNYKVRRMAGPGDSVVPIWWAKIFSKAFQMTIDDGVCWCGNETHWMELFVAVRRARMISPTYFFTMCS